MTPSAHTSRIAIIWSVVCRLLTHAFVAVEVRTTQTLQTGRQPLSGHPGYLKNHDWESSATFGRQTCKYLPLPITRSRLFQSPRGDDNLVGDTTTNGAIEANENNNDVVLDAYRVLAQTDPEWFQEFVVSTAAMDHDKNVAEGEEPALSINTEQDEKVEKHSTSDNGLSALIQQFQDGDLPEAPLWLEEEEEEEEETSQEIVAVESGNDNDSVEIMTMTPETFEDSDNLQQGDDAAENNVEAQLPDTNTETEVDALVEKVNNVLSTSKSTTESNPKQRTEAPAREDTTSNGASQEVQEQFKEEQGPFIPLAGDASESPQVEQQPDVPLESPKAAGMFQPLLDMFSSTPANRKEEVKTVPAAQTDAGILKPEPVAEVPEDGTNVPSASTETKEKVDAAIPAMSLTDESQQDEVNLDSFQDKSEQESVEDQVILYRSQQSAKYQQLSLTTLANLGYRPEHVLSFDPEALSLILENNVRKPKDGVPEKWKRTRTSDNEDGEDLIKVLTTTEAKELLELNKPSEERAFVSPSEPKVSAKKRTNRATVGVQRNPDEEVDTNDEKKSTPGGTFAVFRISRDPSSPYRKVPIKLLLRLRYEESDIRILDSRALDYILVKKRPKPKNGIPDSWKIKERERQAYEVLVLNSAKASALVEGRKVDDAGEDTMDEPLMSSETRPDRRVRQPPQQSKEKNERLEKRRRPPQRQQLGSNDSEERRRRDVRITRSGYQDNGRPKPIYSGRPPPSQAVKLNERPDPPKPQKFWPDMRTFRGLLRDESNLRLKILGDDWEDIVRQESDWRLKLYKDWLWTLHDGIGNPIVESRSDRARRYRIRETESSLPSSSRGLTPRSQKKKKKKRRNPSPRVRPYE